MIAFLEMTNSIVCLKTIYNPKNFLQPKKTATTISWWLFAVNLKLKIIILFKLCGVGDLRHF